MYCSLAPTVSGSLRLIFDYASEQGFPVVGSRFGSRPRMNTERASDRWGDPAALPLLMRTWAASP